jgi:hypothetical protein
MRQVFKVPSPTLQATDQDVAQSGEIFDATQRRYFLARQHEPDFEACSPRGAVTDGDRPGVQFDSAAHD